MSNFCARIVVFLLLACAATIQASGQTVRLIEGEWRDIAPSKTETVGGKAAIAGQILNDPLFSRQKEMFEKTGMIRAWQRYGLNLSSSIPVVYIDTGVDASHPDLEGSVDCELSQTFIEGGGSPCVDEWGHGTAVATIGGARGNDGRGMAGFGSHRIISYKVMVPGKNQFGQTVLRTSLDAVIKAFRAVKELAELYPVIIVNTSFSIDGVDPVLNALMKELEIQNKVFLVSATDNVALDSESLPGLPCFASPFTNVFCVGSVTMSGNLTSWSAYGTRINYSGRCENIVASYPGPRYGTFIGNSGCAPQVSAVSAHVADHFVQNGKEVSASILKDLMWRGAVFTPGLISAIRQQEILYPITLDAEKALRVTERALREPTATIRLLSLDSKSLKAETLKDATGRPLFEINITAYKVVGEGFDESTVGFLNGVPIEVEILSQTELRLNLGQEISFFGGGSNNVLYLAKLDEDGEIDPFSVVRLLSGFNIR